VHNNIIAQLELLGMPYSSGFDAGEGVRLLLGSDALGVKGVANKTEHDLPTRWLVPASAAAFDARCAKADMDAALADGCVLLGECVKQAGHLGASLRGQVVEHGLGQGSVHVHLSSYARELSTAHGGRLALGTRRRHARGQLHQRLRRRPPARSCLEAARHHQRHRLPG
jgi:hypothetical protein